MKVVTWNINGIRATKVPLKKVLDSLDADVICLQETKVTRDQLDEASAIVEGYNSYFSFSKARSGYSGVATFVRDHATPFKVEEGLSGMLSDDNDVIGSYGDLSDFDSDELNALDNEGRAIITQHNLKTESGKKSVLTVINVYCPRADPEREDRKSYKLRFYKLLQTRAEAIVTTGSHVIILGDVNTSHKKIDNCDPGENFEEQAGRKWLDELLWQKDCTDGPIREKAPEVVAGSPDKHSTDSPKKPGHYFVDSFRYFYPDKTDAYTCWCSMTGARATNYGTRIDYIFADRELLFQSFTDCVLLQDFEGSDHCPVKATLNWEGIPADRCPQLCTKYLPEFTGKQQKLSAFFTKVGKVSDNNKECVNSHNPKLTKAVDNGKERVNIEQSICSAVTSSPKAPIKRSGSSLVGKNSKKLKSDVKKPGIGPKQGSLLTFFSKKEELKPVTATNVSVNDLKCTVVSDKSDIYTDEKDASKYFTNSNSERTTDEESKKTTSNSNEKQSVVNTWKNLLKGPPPPPNCKGHSEPCLLRTVKKEESLNKGRQFWVCNRPEGHKTNPEARCDTFIWVSKKK